MIMEIKRMKGLSLKKNHVNAGLHVMNRKVLDLVDIDSDTMGCTDEASDCRIWCFSSK